MNGLRAARLVAIEQRQHLRAAVSAAHADESGDRGIAPRRLNRRRANLRRPARYSLSGEDRLVVDRLETQPADLVDALVELVAIERAGGGDDGKAIAGLERARLQHHANRAISSAIARCSSRPSTCCRARGPSGRRGTRPPPRGTALSRAAGARARLPRASTAGARLRPRGRALRARPPACRGRRCKSARRRIPASIASTAADGTAYSLAIAFISRSSLRMTPW